MLSLTIVKVICYFGLALLHALPRCVPEHYHRVFIGLLYLGVALALLIGPLVLLF